MGEVIVKRVVGALSILGGLAAAVFLTNWSRPFGVLGGSLLFVVFGWTWLRHQGKGIDQITPPDLKCPELDAATAQARATLPRFLPHAERGGDGAFVKFPIRTPRGNTEHIWGYVHFFKDGRFNVSLANRPYDEKESADGRRDVPLADVEDWQIMLPDGRIRGAHSLIALFRYHENRGVRLSPKMKKQKASLIDAGLS